MPADKIAWIAALQAQNRDVLMVGNGLNNASLSGRRQCFAVGGDGRPSCPPGSRGRLPGYFP